MAYDPQFDHSSVAKGARSFDDQSAQARSSSEPVHLVKPIKPSSYGRCVAVSWDEAQ